VGLVGLGFAPGPVADSIQNDSLLMAQELCRGGSLRDLVVEQMISPREVLRLSVPQHGACLHLRCSGWTVQGLRTARLPHSRSHCCARSLHAAGSLHHFYLSCAFRTVRRG